jgi:phosphoglycolate phosphatase
MHDILGAKSCGLSSIGVLYGYGGLKELQEAGADYVFATTKELEEFFGV